MQNHVLRKVTFGTMFTLFDPVRTLALQVVFHLFVAEDDFANADTLAVFEFVRTADDRAVEKRAHQFVALFKT